jgi:signal recognition particle GTPase
MNQPVVTNRLVYLAAVVFLVFAVIQLGELFGQSYTNRLHAQADAIRSANNELSETARQSIVERVEADNRKSAEHSRIILEYLATLKQALIDSDVSLQAAMKDLTEADKEHRDEKMGLVKRLLDERAILDQQVSDYCKSLREGEMIP